MSKSTISLTDEERKYIEEFLTLSGYKILHSTKSSVEFINSGKHTYYISHSRLYEYHITVKGEGNTYGIWGCISGLLQWMYCMKGTPKLE